MSKRDERLTQMQIRLIRQYLSRGMDVREICGLVGCKPALVLQMQRGDLNDPV